MQKQGSDIYCQTVNIQKSNTNLHVPTSSVFLAHTFLNFRLLWEFVCMEQYILFKILNFVILVQKTPVYILY